MRALVSASAVDGGCCGVDVDEEDIFDGFLKTIRSASIRNEVPMENRTETFSTDNTTQSAMERSTVMRMRTTMMRGPNPNPRLADADRRTDRPAWHF